MFIGIVDERAPRVHHSRRLVDLIDRRATDEVYESVTVVVFHARPHLLVPGITPVELAHIFCTQFIDFHLIFAFLERLRARQPASTAFTARRTFLSTKNARVRLGVQVL